MTGPTQLIGQINAIKTLIENFPMSILDINGKRYNSIFEFLLDILVAFGFGPREVAVQLISEVFGKISQTVVDKKAEIYGNVAEVQNAVQGFLNGQVDSLTSWLDTLDDGQVSDFLESLEDAVKNILMSLLVGISSCDAFPFIRKEFLDYHDGGGVPWGIPINREEIDLFDIFSISPFSNEGKFYYNAEFKTKYYKKISEQITVQENKPVEVYDCSKFSRIYIEFLGNHEDYVSGSLFVDDEFRFVTESPLPYDLRIAIEYTEAIKDESESAGKIMNCEVVIKAGEKYSESVFITPYFPNDTKQFIRSIKFGPAPETEGGMMLGTIWAYFDKQYCEDVIKFYESKNNLSFDNIKFGSSSDCPKTTVTNPTFSEKTVYRYVEFDGVGEECYLMNYLPEEPTESDPEFIEYHEGLTENSASMTNDMNTFLWYVFNNECPQNSNDIGFSQIEANKQMWDSRVSSRKNGYNVRTNAELWNRWYNSKTVQSYKPDADKFSESNLKLKFNGVTDTFNDEVYENLHPILQFYDSDFSDKQIMFSSQAYYKPKSKVTGDRRLLNATIFEFNRDYLKNIRIFNPKVIMYNMIDYLLNGTLSASMGIHISPKVRNTKMKLKKAVKKYIEASESEIDDCYYTFSNEEFNEMLQDAMLSRYKAVRNGEDNSNAVEHNFEDYMKELDYVNLSATAVNQTEEITRVITDVSTKGSNRMASTNVDLELHGLDNNFWERFLMALAEPIIESIFTPQVLLLFQINLYVMGLINPEESLFGDANTKLLNFIFNKLMSMVLSIVRYIIDRIVKWLLELFVEVSKDIIFMNCLMLYKERLDAWLRILANALEWLRLMKLTFKNRKNLIEIDDVDYAEIDNVQNKPESNSNC